MLNRYAVIRPASGSGSLLNGLPPARRTKANLAHLTPRHESSVEQPESAGRVAWNSAVPIRWCTKPTKPPGRVFLGYGKTVTQIFLSSDRPEANSRNYHKPRQKRKGGSPCEEPPSVRFFEDLVRLPNHNVAIPKSFATRELGPRSLHASGTPRCKSLPIPFAILVADFLERPQATLSCWKIALPLN